MEPIHLTTHYSFLQGGELTPFCLPYCFDGDSTPLVRPAVIVVPGGAYAMVSKREGFSVAASFLALGFQTFVLTYKTVSDGGPLSRRVLRACLRGGLSQEARF